ncbi:LysE family transporter [Anderseniella sp. Alg231-50]|uniref:LysE family transporter n=1 Tax=Anderseniella sp. Alg231-50 TaxID=1922226 RepID=UPI000D5506AD
MIDQTTLITYVAIVIGFVFIPGPATVLTVARATTSGTRVGLATGLGIAVGDVIHTALAVLGISAIILASAFLFSLIKYLGAAYLVYLGIRAIFEKAPANTAGSQSIRLTPGEAFRQGILAEVLNPKTAMFFLAFLPQFVKPENGSVFLQLTTLGIILMALGLTSTVIFALCAGSVGGFLKRNPTVVKWQGRVVGSIYCALGVRLAFQER